MPRLKSPKQIEIKSDRDYYNRIVKWIEDGKVYEGVVRSIERIGDDLILKVFIPKKDDREVNGKEVDVIG